MQQAMRPCWPGRRALMVGRKTNGDACKFYFGGLAGSAACPCSAKSLFLLSHWPSVQRPRHSNRFGLIGHSWLNGQRVTLCLSPSLSHIAAYALLWLNDLVIHDKDPKRSCVASVHAKQPLYMHGKLERTAQATCENLSKCWKHAYGSL